MIKLSITQLETARRNPMAFARSLKNKTFSSEFSYSKYAAWKNAILNWHKVGNYQQALKYLQDALQKFESVRRRPDELTKYMVKFDAYIRDHSAQGYSFIESRKRIAIPIFEDVTLIGQIPIINLNNRAGYSIIFFDKDSSLWEAQLKFPLLQSFFSQTVYGCVLSEIEVGIFSFIEEHHYTKIYSRKEIESALLEITEVSKKIYNVMK